MTTEIVLASRNPGKLAEMQALFAPLGWRLRLVSEFTSEVAAETASTFVENALLKARHAAAVSGLAALADDSGLEVDALNGAPGVWSARYAGEGATDAANNRKLLDALDGIPQTQRGARFVSVLALLRHAADPTPVIAEGYWRGCILEEVRGSSGFGYDPLFFVPELEVSAAELESSTKNQISHRARAVQALLEQLQRVTRKA